MAIGKSDRWSSVGSGSGISTGPSLDVLACMLALLCIGTVMVFSATIGFADIGWRKATTTTYVVMHLRNIMLGLAFGFLIYKVPMKFWFKYSTYIGAAAFVLLVAVSFVPGVGKSVNGATRWINLGFMSLQVSEVMKFAALIFAAAFTVKQQDYMHSFTSGFLPMAVAMVCIAFVIMSQPDLGATAVICAEIIGILFLGGLSLHIFFAVIASLLVFIAWMIIDTPWRLGRLTAYLDPWAEENVLDKAYQLSHSLIAFGRGELTGVGIGGSVEKLNYLPEAHTDFIMSIIAEETGFVGVVVVVFIYYWLIRKAIEIGRQAIKLDRYFQGLVAQGVGLWLGVQVFINVGVASGLLPTKGLTLPFISYGGSAIIFGMASIALLLRVDKENKILMRGGQV